MIDFLRNLVGKITKQIDRPLTNLWRKVQAVILPMCPTLSAADEMSAADVISTDCEGAVFELD